MAEYRRPDVYVEEISSFPVSIQEIETAIPAFIGYTEIDPGEPKQVNIWDDFIKYFGKEDKMKDGITKMGYDANNELVIEPEAIMPDHFLYYAMKHYFDHGGGKCFVISCGTYDKAIDKDEINSGFQAAIDIEEVTLLVCPEMVKLADVKATKIDYSDYSEVVAKTANEILDPLTQKLAKFFILDMVDGMAENTDNIEQFDASDFSGLVIEKAGNHMAFYYPYLVSSYRASFTEEFLTNDTGDTPKGLGLKVKDSAGADKTLKELQASTKLLDKAIANTHLLAIAKKLPRVLLPPSAAMAGLYVKVDNDRGVWKSPANVSVTSLYKLNKVINDVVHADLNVRTDNQRSICAIRALQGYGTRVMGGRTLAGSDLDRRYISVSRFMSVAEKSIKNALKRYLFEPNSPATWGLVRGAISNYLSRKWLDGALLGAKAEDSFFVRIGLGTTMTQDDVLNGRLIVEVGMAVVRPAEFIILRFEQFLPKQLS